jgi:hypothetical protein
MNPNAYLVDAQQALGFVTSQTSYIEQQVYEIQYPDIQYPQLIPIDTSANEWAKSVTYFSMNKVGVAGWFHHHAKDIHIADVERAKFEVGVEMADIGYRWTLEEIGQAMMIPGLNLSADRASAARRAYEEFVDRVALHGDTDKNFAGIIDYPGIPTSIADVHVGPPTGTSWTLKTADEILADVNEALTGMWVDTLQIEMADTILLPLRALALIATKRLNDLSSTTILQWLLQNNIYSFTTGRPLLIRGVRGLETAGTGDTGRMIAYRRDPQVIKMHIPMTHRFLPVWQTGPLVFDVPGIFRLAGLEVRRPQAMRYVDGILEEAYE